LVASPSDRWPMNASDVAAPASAASKTMILTGVGHSTHTGRGALLHHLQCNAIQ
jgi:hypothetical protein